MDLAPHSVTEAHSPLDSSLPDSPSQPRRHIRYASPETSTSTSPQVIINTRRHPSSNARRPQPAMSVSPIPLPLPLAPSSQMPDASMDQEQVSTTPPVEGQNHDRMETDDGSDVSDSDSERDTPEGEPSESAPETNHAAHPPEDEAMDTSPDGPSVHVPDVQTGGAGSEQGLETMHIGVIAGGGAETSAAATDVQVDPSLQVSLVASTQQPADIEVAIQNAALGRAVMREELAGDERRARQAARDQREDEGDGDDDSDDSSDEEDHPYWANYKEDTSGPDDRELAIIDDSMDEVSAVDHEYWEKSVFGELDDPEYVPADSGRICWTIKGVRGTPEKPNRERIMRSPSVQIGGLYWNIKFFPRGNDGTEQMSVYIECSPTPYEEIKAKASSRSSEPKANASNDEDNQENRMEDNIPTESPHLVNIVEPIQFYPREAQPDAEVEPPWRAAAQVGCVAYNPDEPRVYASQKSCHTYYNDNPDWGWTRFHGPWDDIHTRKRFQRQALLRNDTLAFTAYIRTVDDPTKSLWWHPPKEKAMWNSLEMTGLRGFECSKGRQSSAVVAAISTWIHLGPIVEMIERMSIPDPRLEPDTRPRPLFEELQDLIVDKADHSDQESDLSLHQFITMLNCDDVTEVKRMDAVLVWESTRRILNNEAARFGMVEDAQGTQNDVFRDVLMLRQPDHFNNGQSAAKFWVQRRDAPELPVDHEPTTVQETLDLASQHPSKAFRTWTGSSEANEHPLILQIELHRQSFDQEDRKWRKLAHRVAIDEEVAMNGHQYTLYGMIVHSGGLESQEFYSVIRPGGPGTRWVKYAGDSSDSKVMILTTKQAVLAHEGGKNSDASVAYLVLYVRTDKILSTLSSPFEKENLALRKTQIQPPSSDKSEIVLYPVHFYGPESFLGFSNHGICDPWSQTTNQDPERVWRLHLPGSIKLRQIKKRLDIEMAKVEENKTESPLKLWIIDVSLGSERPCAGLGDMSEHVDSPLYEIHLYDGHRFWLSGPSSSVIKQMMKQLSAEGSAAFSNLEDEASKPESTEVEAEQPTTTDEIPQPDSGAGATSNAEDASAEADHVEEQAGDGDGDTVMVEPQEPSMEPAQASDDAQETEPTSDPSEPDIVCFVKIFDAESQTLKGIDSFQAKVSSKVVPQVRKVLGVEASEAWDFYYEHVAFVKCKDVIKSSATFLEYCTHSEHHGIWHMVCVAQRRPTASQLSSLETEGKCSNPTEYYDYLRLCNNPAFSAGRMTTGYFAHDYQCVPLKYGRPHGHGTQITLSGDAYTGNFTAGKKSGQGSMDYANGDTYEGEWKNNEPNGQGKMVYAKTGNVYMGGFKKRKRHGEGHMHFKVADEEMMLCRICYENEMDALFYTCGHVVACEECARQVDTCPVCRATVRAVVRWRLTI